MVRFGKILVPITQTVGHCLCLGEWPYLDLIVFRPMKLPEQWQDSQAGVIDVSAPCLCLFHLPHKARTLTATPSESQGSSLGEIEQLLSFPEPHRNYTTNKSYFRVTILRCDLGQSHITSLGKASFRKKKCEGTPREVLEKFWVSSSPWVGSNLYFLVSFSRLYPCLHFRGLMRILE